MSVGEACPTASATSRDFALINPDGGDLITAGDHGQMRQELVLAKQLVPLLIALDRRREARARRRARKLGLAVCKSRTRDPRASDFGTYLLANERNVIECSGLTLDELEEALAA